MASEQSAGSSVVMRARANRKPRPISIAGSFPDKNSRDLSEHVSRSVEKKLQPPSPTPRPSRARSAGSFGRPEVIKSNVENENAQPKPPPPRKPAHVKAAAAARKAAKIQDKGADDIPPLDTSSIKSVSSMEKIILPKIELSESEDNLKEILPSENLESISKDEQDGIDEASNAKKDITQDEYKKTLAEKRRQAREQAEREAELERQKQEELKRIEQERIRQEEEDQKRFEEEQIRLAEQHLKMEEEKLRKAIEEQQKKEEEERKKQQEEIKLKYEKIEQERKAKEEAERARFELEERLRKDEEERLARKKVRQVV